MNAPESETTPSQAPAMPTLTLKRIALSMLGLLVLHAVWGTVVGISNLVELMPPSGGRSLVIGVVAVSAILPLVCFAGLLGRQKWARIGWVALTLLEIASLVFPSMVLKQPIEFSPAPTAGLVLQVLALCLLFIDDRRHGLRGVEAAHA